MRVSSAWAFPKVGTSKVKESLGDSAWRSVYVCEWRGATGDTHTRNIARLSRQLDIGNEFGGLCSGLKRSDSHNQAICRQGQRQTLDLFHRATEDMCSLVPYSFLVFVYVILLPKQLQQTRSYLTNTCLAPSLSSFSTSATSSAATGPTLANAKYSVKLASWAT